MGIAFLKTTRMIRARFEIPYYAAKDYRPVIWIVNHPFWLCGRTQYCYIVVAYADDVEQLMEQWPYANILKIDQKEKIEFSTRFYKPIWYREDVGIHFITDRLFYGGYREPKSKEDILYTRQKIVKNGIDI